MNKNLIDKIINIVNLEFDALFYTVMADDYEIGLIYDRIKKKLKDIE